MNIRYRPAALGAALAAVLAASALTPLAPVASADPPSFEIVLTAGSMATSGDDTVCTATTSASDDVKEIPASGGSASAALSAAQTITDIATQTVVASGTTSSQVSASVTTAGGELRSLTFTDNSSATMSGATPQACTGEKARSVGGGQVRLVLPVVHPGWLEVTTHRGYSGDVEFQVSAGFYPGTSDASEQSELVSYDHGTHTNRMFVPSGRVVVYVNSYVYGSTFSDGLHFQSSSDASSVTATYTPAGEAIGTAAGTSQGLVTLPASADCAAHAATIAVARKAHKWQAKKVVLTVDGSQALTLKPKSNRSVVIPVPASGDFTVAAKVTATKALKKKQRRNLRAQGKRLPKPKTFTVQRTYTACG
ncbi:hypothetical protein [Nocardioides sp.]|uniref:hypothetical protein n=1 Tax=Nocardioides sp. TaxID=35761 RepID=UPI0039E46F22